MRTRLQMSPEEARFSRATMIDDMEGLAAFVGASAPTTEAIDEGLRIKYSGYLHVKEANVPRAETWEIRFHRSPGGWIAKGCRTSPDPTPEMRGRDFPRYVRQVVPVTEDGVLPASLAPRRDDLPRAMPGTWRNVGPAPRRHTVPTVRVKAQAPRHGVIFYATGHDGGPLIVRFPANKSDLGPALRRLAVAANRKHMERERRGHEKNGTARGGA